MTDVMQQLELELDDAFEIEPEYPDDTLLFPDHDWDGRDFNLWLEEA